MMLKKKNKAGNLKFETAVVLAESDRGNDMFAELKSSAPNYFCTWLCVP